MIWGFTELSNTDVPVWNWVGLKTLRASLTINMQHSKLKWESLTVNMSDYGFWQSNQRQFNRRLGLSWWRYNIYCVRACIISVFADSHRQLPDLRFLRFKLLHSCDPGHAKWIPSPSSWHCHGNHLDPCHWCRCSVNRESERETESETESGRKAIWGQEEVKRGRCGVRETVNDKMRVNISCGLTIKTFLIMQRSSEHWLKWVLQVTEGFTQLQFC